MAVGEGGRVDAQAAALGHVVVHEFGEAVVVIADGAADGTPGGVEDEGRISSRGPVGLGGGQVHLVVVAGEALGGKDCKSVVDYIGLCCILDRHAHHHVEAELLGQLGYGVSGGAGDGLGELVLHLLGQGLFGLVVVGGQCHLGEDDKVRAFLCGCLHIAHDAVEVLLLLPPHRLERHGRNGDDVFVHEKLPFQRRPPFPA